MHWPFSCMCGHCIMFSYERIMCIISTESLDALNNMHEQAHKILPVILSIQLKCNGPEQAGELPNGYCTGTEHFQHFSSILEAAVETVRSSNAYRLPTVHSICQALPSVPIYLITVNDSSRSLQAPEVFGQAVYSCLELPSHYAPR